MRRSTFGGRQRLAQSILLFSLTIHIAHADAGNATGDYQIVSTALQSAEQGANFQDWQRIQTLRAADGSTLQKTNSTYTELETGKFYRDGERWLESRELIESYPGGAIASYGGHKVVFAADFLSDVLVDMETPDGKRLQSRVLGLSYSDPAGGKSVWVAEAASSTGKIITSNQVLYPEAFKGVQADVRYTYTKAGLEQDVILREQPPTPESFGLDSKTTRLQVVTEFLSPPAPAIESKTLGQDAELFEDQTLDFGVMQMGAGKAFLLGDATAESQVATEDNTSVTITPSSTADLVGHPGQYPITPPLMKGQTYQINSRYVTSLEDVTGTMVVSDKPIGVFAGAAGAYVPNDKFAANPIIQEQIPIAAWGQQVSSLPFASRTGGDTYRVLAANNNTVVTINGAVVATLNAGEVYEGIVGGPVVFHGSKPIQVSHFANGTGYDGNTGDPCEILLSPIGSWLQS